MANFSWQRLRQQMPRHRWVLGLLICLSRAGIAAAQSQVDMPVLASQSDTHGNTWQMNATGTFSQQGNETPYTDGAELCVNGQVVKFSRPQAKVAASGEVILDGIVGKNFLLTRRMLVSADGSTLRVLDVIRNTGTAPLQLWYCAHASTPLAKVKFTQATTGQQLACIAKDQRGAFLVECFGGEGGQFSPKFDASEGNNGIVANFNIPVGPDATITIAHLHAISNDEDGADVLQPAVMAELFSDVAPVIRRTIANFHVPASGNSDLPTTRDADIVELGSGERVHGTLKTATFEIHGVYGSVTVAADRVLGFANTSGATHRQALELRDGSLLTGQLAGTGIDIDDGQAKATVIPLSDIERLAYRAPATQPATEPADMPWIDTTAGDHLCIRPLTGTIPIRTLYGKIDVPLAMVAEISLGVELSAHELQFADGSHLSGLINVDALDVQLADAVSATPLHIPIDSIVLMHIANASRRLQPEEASLRLSGEDCLLARLEGPVHVETKYNTLTIAADDVRQLERLTEGSTEVAITRGDGSTVQGQLRETTLKFQTQGGLSVELPAAMITQYAPPSTK